MTHHLDIRHNLPLLIAPRLDGIIGSPMMALVAKTAELKRQGRDIIGLAAGEPDFPTPEHIRKAAIAAIEGGDTRYTPVGGTAALKSAIVTKFQRENQLTYSADQVMAGTGGKQIIYNAFMATVSTGDEVIIPTPSYPAYSEIARMCGGVPIDIHCPREQGFKLRPEQLEAAITPRTKWLVLNSPSNPTGAVYSGGELRELGQVLLRYPHVAVLTDDIYEHLLFVDERFTLIVNEVPELLDRTLLVNGVSKAYCMTGWRLGYGAGPSGLIKAMTTVQSQSTSNPCSVSQAAACAALEGPQDYLADLSKIYRSRRDLMLDAFARSPHLECDVAGGAFYLFPTCSGAFGKRSSLGVIQTDIDFVTYLLDVAGVVVVPGSVFGAPAQFRLSYAASETELQEAGKRIVEACSALS